MFLGFFFFVFVAVQHYPRFWLISDWGGDSCLKLHNQGWYSRPVVSHNYYSFLHIWSKFKFWNKLHRNQISVVFKAFLCAIVFSLFDYGLLFFLTALSWKGYISKMYSNYNQTSQSWNEIASARLSLFFFQAHSVRVGFFHRPKRKLALLFRHLKSDVTNH